VELKNNFDINEFLGYILPGSLLLLWLQYTAADLDVSGLQTQWQGMPTAYAGVLIIVLFIAGSMICGYLCSIFTRFFMRPLVWMFNGNPRKVVLYAQDGCTWLDKLRAAIAKRFPEKQPVTEDRFYSPAVLKKISDQFHAVYGLDLKDPTIANAAPRMIRSYVLQNSQAAFFFRERVVRTRAFCGHLALPLLLIGVSLFLNGQVILGFLDMGLVILLTWKQSDLDEREWKEIYMSFIGLSPLKENATAPVT